MKKEIFLLRRATCALLGLVLAGTPFAALAKGKASHVVVLVWDGMRPDFISPQFTPNLYELAANGVFFRNHHPVYISSTEVNGTAIATGCHPTHSGIIANTDYRPEISYLGPMATEGVESVRRGDLLTEGNYLKVPTVAEMLQENGIPTVTAGTKAVVFLQDRDKNKTSEAGTNSFLLYRGKTLPRSAEHACIKANEDKAFPTNTVHPNSAADTWTTKAMLNALWRKGVPKYSLLWLSEPDASQHAESVGSTTALAAIESSDKLLGEVLKKLDEKGVRDQTDIVVVSDHGFSTILRAPDMVEAVKKAKIRGARKFEDPDRGDVLVVGLGGSTCFYVYEHDDDVVRKLVAFLQTTDFAGVVFCRLPIEGTFPLDTVRLNPTNVAPDVVVSFRWFPDRNEHGAPGLVLSDGGTKGKGTHASLSRFDMHNTCVAHGPDFKKGYVSDLPSGNIDITPTVLYLLGVKPGVPLDGRVLTEGLATHSGPPLTVETKTLEATRELGLFRWKQYLKYSKVENAVYFDEGNGAALWK